MLRYSPKAVERSAKLKTNSRALRESVSQAMLASENAMARAKANHQSATLLVERSKQLENSNGMSATIFRRHPLMTYRGARIWPPVWVEKYGDGKLSGEIGELTHLGNNPDESAALFLHITHDGVPYCGKLLIQDPGFRQSVYEVLRKHIGHSIKEIGDLDLSLCCNAPSPRDFVICPDPWPSPRVYFETVVTAQNACHTMIQLRETMEHKRAENRLLFAMLKRQLAETEFFIQHSSRSH